MAVRGPLQAGKTTSQLQIIAELLGEGIPSTNIRRILCDRLASAGQPIYPILGIANWVEHNIATDCFNALAHPGRKAYLFLDEVQNLDSWSKQLKSLMNTVAVQILVVDGSTLRIERGRDSLAGRPHTVKAGPPSLTAIGEFRKLKQNQGWLTRRP